jgi:hypothetical protein
MSMTCASMVVNEEGCTGNLCPEYYDQKRAVIDMHLYHYPPICSISRALFHHV